MNALFFVLWGKPFESFTDLHIWALFLRAFLSAIAQGMPA